jgi:multiple sugar transport system substrate-binding protein
VQEQFDEIFMAKYPQIIVDRQNFNWDQQLWVVRHAAGTLPDIFYLLGGWAQTWIRNNAFIDLNPYINKTPSFNLNDFYLNGFRKYQHNGGIYLIPYAWDPIMVFYNRELFDNQGLSYPSPSWTYDDMLAIARKLTIDNNGDGRTDIWGVHSFLTLMGWPVHSSLLQPFGGRLTTDDSETRLAFNDPKTRAAMDWWLDLVTEHRVSPTPDEMNTGPALENGKIAMVFTGSWGINTYRQHYPDLNWDVAHVPIGPAGRFTAAESSGYGISATSKHPDEAWIYLNEYMSTKGQVMMWGNTYEQLSRRSAAMQAMDLPGAPSNFRAFYEALEHYAVDAPMNPALAQVYPIITNEMYNVLYGRKSRIAAYEEIQRLGNGILARESTP